MTGWFARIEHACAAFIERTFARTFPSDLEPAQVARKLVATMEARTRGDDGALVAPGSYVIFMNPSDFERLAEHRAYLESGWAELLVDMGNRVGIAFPDGPPSIESAPRESVPLGAVDVMVASDLTVAIPSPTPALPRRFVLRMVRGVPEYGVYPVREHLRVGRGDDSDVFLVDPSVSRNHATVELHAGSPVVRDLDSTNGTYVNGERVTTRTLMPGDLVMFGNTQLLLEARE